MPYDYSTYEGLKKRIQLEHPERSALTGMMRSKSMPPYPLPSIPKSTIDAVQHWIANGAPE